jgi:hypothetical protein
MFSNLVFSRESHFPMYMVTYIEFIWFHNKNDFIKTKLKKKGCNKNVMREIDNERYIPTSSKAGGQLTKTTQQVILIHGLPQYSLIFFVLHIALSCSLSRSRLDLVFKRKFSFHFLATERIATA